MTNLTIAAAQVASAHGDITANVADHVAAIAAAARHGVSVLVFPELSLTGYDPALAAGLAVSPADDRLAPLAAAARRHRMDVVVGVPLQTEQRPLLGAILFTADGTARPYGKMHLGAGERPHFAAGGAPLTFATGGRTVGVAVCADASQPSHPQRYADAGAAVYAAGVFLNAEWYATDAPRLTAHAARYGLLVVMANHADSPGPYTSVGRSAVWSPTGDLLAQAADTAPCLVVASDRTGTWHGEVVGL